MHKLLGHIPFLSQLGERFLDLFARPKQFKRSEFTFAGKCADSVATCVSMHPYKSMTNICAHWSCNFGNVNDSFPFFGATFLEQFWCNVSMKRQRHDEYVSVIGANYNCWISSLCSMSSVKEKSTICFLVCTLQLKHLLVSFRGYFVTLVFSCYTVTSVIWSMGMRSNVLWLDSWTENEPPKKAWYTAEWLAARLVISA